MRSLVLVISLIGLWGCASTPKPAKFESEWEFHDFPTEQGTQRKACLSMEQVQKLREILVLRCEEKSENGEL